MNAIDTTKTDLHWNVLTMKGPGLVRDLPPGKEKLNWVAFSSTLISGERDAILVDISAAAIKGTRRRTRS